MGALLFLVIFLESEYLVKTISLLIFFYIRIMIFNVWENMFIKPDISSNKYFPALNFQNNVAFCVIFAYKKNPFLVSRNTRNKTEILEIFSVFLFVNCLYYLGKIPPFLNKKTLRNERKQ